jgi:hypothetical protein
LGKNLLFDGFIWSPVDKVASAEFRRATLPAGIEFERVVGLET